MPGISEWVVIGAVVVLLFGSSKLPQLGGALGETIKNFKKSIKDDDKSLKDKDNNEPKS